MKKVIDLSDHNGNVDFTKVKEDGIQDVILRIGWIGNKENHTMDEKFNEYYKQAKQNGFNVGVYIYDYCESIEALTSGLKWVIKNLTNKVLELPIFLDLEDKQIEKLSKDILTNQAKFFCEYIEMNGFKAGIYANKYWFTTKINHNELLNYTIWWAEYNKKDNHTSPLKVDLWQYTSKGKINGITGNVDISKCFCKENTENITGEPKKESKESGDFEVKDYVNGSTREPVYQDIHCTKEIGSINPRESAKCYGIINNKALVVYKIDGTNNLKTGFVKWLGGVK